MEVSNVNKHMNLATVIMIKYELWSIIPLCDTDLDIVEIVIYMIITYLKPTGSTFGGMHTILKVCKSVFVNVMCL